MNCFRLIAIVASLLFAAPAMAGPNELPARSSAVESSKARARTENAANRLRQNSAILGQRRAEKAGLQAKYKAELDALDRVKKQRRSWRRDRQLRAAYAQSQATAKSLALMDRVIAELSARVISNRQTLGRAIDAELIVADARRSGILRRTKRALVASTSRNARKIVLPDERIDPLASPAELEEQAAILAQSEKELERQVAELADRAQRYDHMEKLRRQRTRAAELGSLDDNRPRRTSTAPNSQAGRQSTESDDFGNAPAPGDPGGTGGGGDGASPGESPPLGNSASSVAELSTVLADVVDGSSLAEMRQADRSGDPMRKARAAGALRAQVEKRLKKLRERRKAMETRARALRRRQ